MVNLNLNIFIYICILETENKKITQENEELETQSDALKSKIRELEIKIELVKKETEEEKSMFMERDLLNRIRFEELESKFSELQQKAFSLQQERQKKNKTRVVSLDNKSYRMKKIRKQYQIETSNIQGNLDNMKEDNRRIKNSIEEKKNYLNELLLSLKKISESQSTEPGYLRAKSQKKVLSANS